MAQFQSTSVTGSLTVTGQVIAQTLNVQQVTSSIVYSSGSNVFGNSLGNTQQFTGSVSVTGSLTVNEVMSLNNDGTYGSTYKTLGLTGNTNGSHRIFAGTADNIYIAAATGRGIYLCTNGTVTPQLTISSTGAATFASSINAKTLTLADSAVIQVIESTTGTNFNGLELKNSGGSFYFGQDSSTGNFYGSNTAYSGCIYTSQARPIVFFTSAAERMRITSGGNVGIGTTNPGYRLNIGGSASSTLGFSPTDVNSYTEIYFNRNTSTTISYIGVGVNSTVTAAGDEFVIQNNLSTGNIVFRTNGGSGATERIRVTNNGLTFNGDTAAANALDDYEEGTWTPVIRGSGTAGTYELSTPTYSTYTKIGRQVTVATQITLQGSITGGGTGYLQITGLPFTKANNMSFMGAITLTGVDFTGQFVSVKFVTVSPSTVLYLAETVDNGASIDLPISAISAGDGIGFTITYFE